MIQSISDVRRRYVLCGLSIRAIYQFVLPLIGKGAGNDFSAVAELCAVLDVDRGRVQQFCRKIGVDLPFYSPDELGEMVREHRPDVVIIAGPDATHFGYIMQALELGCDVIVEKPMVITSREAIAVLQQEQKTGRSVRVGFNVRYGAMQGVIKRLLQEGAIGKVTNIELNYNLDTEHGASYFFRWNRRRELSGGLNVHKLCHHFDLVNWWLDDWPEQVFAFGALNYYGKNGVHRPRKPDGTPLSHAETKANCSYFKKHYQNKLQPEALRMEASWDVYGLPYNVQYPPEQASYLYDDEIDIEDTYGVLMRYRNGPILNYSINFSAAWEGFNLGINGTHGRIEASHRVKMAPGKEGNADFLPSDVMVRPLFAESYSIEVPKLQGAHGGADEPMQRDLFGVRSEESDTLGRAAGSLAGAYAVAAGEAVWLACSTGEPVQLPTFETMEFTENPSQLRAKLSQ